MTLVFFQFHIDHIDPKSLSQVKNVVSSEKLDTFVNSHKKNKLFKYILKRRGPRNDPRGTHCKKFAHLLKLFFIFVPCRLLER